MELEYHLTKTVEYIANCHLNALEPDYRERTVEDDFTFEVEPTDQDYIDFYGRIYETEEEYLEALKDPDFADFLADRYEDQAQEAFENQTEF